MVNTDNSAISYINHKKELSALEQRWMARLADYEVTYKYRSVKENLVADVLSRVRYMQDREVDDYEGDIAELGLVDILPMMERDKLVLEQSKDIVIKKALVVAGKNDYVGRLVVKEGVLFETREGHTYRLMVPKSLMIDVLRGAHEEHCHQWIDKTISKIDKTYTRLDKYRNIMIYIRKCEIVVRQRNHIGSRV